MSDESDRLKEARKAAGFKSAADAAERLKLDYPTYAGHENGSRGFDKDQARRYASTFKISVLWLLYGLGSPSKSFDQEILDLPLDKRRQAQEFIQWLKSKEGS